MLKNNADIRNASRKAAFIDKWSFEYQSSPIFKRIVDNTVYLTEDEKRQSEALIGGRYAQDGSFIGI